jgi:hypothetical protein
MALHWHPFVERRNHMQKESRKCPNCYHGKLSKCEYHDINRPKQILQLRYPIHKLASVSYFYFEDGNIILVKGGHTNIELKFKKKLLS